MVGAPSTNEFFQARFINRDFACAECLDFAWIVINANDIVTNIGKTRAGNEADITGTDNGDVHKLLKLAERRTGMLRRIVPPAINFLQRRSDRNSNRSRTAETP
jgi:hypothetical protein